MGDNLPGLLRLADETLNHIVSYLSNTDRAVPPKPEIQFRSNRHLEENDNGQALDHSSSVDSLPSIHDKYANDIFHFRAVCTRIRDAVPLVGVGCILTLDRKMKKLKSWEAVPEAFKASISHLTIIDAAPEGMTARLNGPHRGAYAEYCAGSRLCAVIKGLSNLEHLFMHCKPFGNFHRENDNHICRRSFIQLGTFPKLRSIILHGAVGSCGALLHKVLFPHTPVLADLSVTPHHLDEDVRPYAGLRYAYQRTGSIIERASEGTFDMVQHLRLPYVAQSLETMVSLADQVGKNMKTFSLESVYPRALPTVSMAWNLPYDYDDDDSEEERMQSESRLDEPPNVSFVTQWVDVPRFLTALAKMPHLERLEAVINVELEVEDYDICCHLHRKDATLVRVGRAAIEHVVDIIRKQCPSVRSGRMWLAIEDMETFWWEWKVEGPDDDLKFDAVKCEEYHHDGADLDSNVETWKDDLDSDYSEGDEGGSDDDSD